MHCHSESRNLDVIIVEPVMCENNDSMHNDNSRAHCDGDTPHIGSNLLDFEEVSDEEHDDDLEGNKAKIHYDGWGARFDTWFVRVLYGRDCVGAAMNNSRDLPDLFFYSF